MSDRNMDPPFEIEERWYQLTFSDGFTRDYQAGQVNQVRPVGTSKVGVFWS